MVPGAAAEGSGAEPGAMPEAAVDADVAGGAGPGWYWLRAAFPTAGPSSTPGMVRVAAYTLGLLALTVLALLRQPGVPAAQTLWAEDGVIFYAQALSKPLLRSLVTAYNGYDQLVPRLAVQLARAAPVRDASMVVTFAGAIGLAVLGCLVFHMARGHISPAPLRALLVVGMVLLPVANYELLDNLVNLPWWMFFAAFWALLWRPRGAGGAAVAALLCALAAASEPLVALLLPLAAARAVALRRPRDQAAGAGLIVGLAFQLVVVLEARGGRSFPVTGLAGVPSAFAVRVGLGWLTGRQGTADLTAWDRPLAEVLGAVLLVAIIAAGLKWGSRSVRALTVTAAVLAPICFGFPVWLRGAAPIMSLGATEDSIGFAGRYAATPLLMELSVVLALTGHLVSVRGRGPYRPLWAAVSACTLLLPAWVVDFRDDNGRMYGPTWSGQLALADAHCQRWNSNGLARVMVPPLDDHFVIHCRVLGATPHIGPVAGPLLSTTARGGNPDRRRRVYGHDGRSL